MRSPRSLGQRRGWLGSRRGATAIEFGFTMPVLFTMAIGTLELGNFLTQQQRVVQATYEATRVASIGEDMITDEAIAGRAEQALRNSGVDPEGLEVGVVWSSDGIDDLVTVSCTLPVEPIVGMIDLPGAHTATFTMVQRGI